MERKSDQRIPFEYGAIGTFRARYRFALFDETRIDDKISN